MPHAAHLRATIEQSLADRIPSALTPRPPGERESTPCGIDALDQLLQGGFPAGAIAEIVGPESSGRTTAALAFLARLTAEDQACAWIDVADALDPESAAANGVQLDWLLWVRCADAVDDCGSSPRSSGAVQHDGAAQVPAHVANEHTGSREEPRPPAAHSGGGSPHPRTEVRGMPQAIEQLLAAQPRCAAVQPSRRKLKRMIGTPGAPNRALSHASVAREEQIPTDRQPARRGSTLLRSTHTPETLPITSTGHRASTPVVAPGSSFERQRRPRQQPYDALDRALRVTDLLLQAGGFRALVLDLGSTPPEQAWRIPLATWFRFRAACERSRASFLLLTQHPCARSSAELVLRMHTGELQHTGPIVCGIHYRASMERQRERRAVSNVVPMRKPAQSASGAWQARNTWVRA